MPADLDRRTGWMAAASAMLDDVAPFRSASRSLVMLPGRPSASGSRSDGFEGFARTFWLTACAAAHSAPETRASLLDGYAEALAAGTDARHPERWPHLDETPQIMVECGSLAFALFETREQLWDALPDATRQRVVEYLLAAQTDVSGNWIFFRVLVHAFLRSVGYDIPVRSTVEDLDRIETYRRGPGWYSDGDDGREHTFDYYNSWSFHLYPALWARMEGARIDPGRVRRYAAESAAHARSLLRMIGRDGAPIYQGRSLIYRAGVAASLPATALLDAPVGPGELRSAAARVLSYFLRTGARHGAPLSMGWAQCTPEIAQDYSGPGSPYWMSKAFVGLLLDPQHPYWTEPAESLPVDAGDFIGPEPTPGWLVHGTAEDGLIRVINHGTWRPRERRDPHSRHLRDDPNYARIAYSTATAPVLDQSLVSEDAPIALPDNSVFVVDASGRPLLRENLTVTRMDESTVESTFTLVSPEADLAPVEVELASAIRDGQEHRSARLLSGGPRDLFFTGYPISGEADTRTAPGGAAVRAPDGLRSTLRTTDPTTATAWVDTATHPSGFGRGTSTPVVCVPDATVGTWFTVVCALSRSSSHSSAEAEGCHDG
ncbi:MAG TPA: DUF2264 domain-containing protein [Microbacterium sp.]|uniref:DUF2264 domain-containing protein n=1 Tax=Microbacterium sp. TaxID=51671 RepID=UPI002B47F38E|nr:DUF2264 domain-containing protein [Microbacterium sp.]HKT57699.1 DUF2264 domain-containing protein [Microbacterium sp.]